MDYIYHFRCLLWYWSLYPFNYYWSNKCMKLQNVSIGADPEVFVTKGGVITSAIGLIGGTKIKPLPVIEGALQEDNVLAEFNIEPCYNEADFLRRINSVMQQLNQRLGGDYSTVVRSSHHFDINYLSNNPKAMEFGCDLDMNCWTGAFNPSPNSATTLRTAGGHVHIGYDKADAEVSLKIAQLCDVLLGVPSVLIDNDIERRSLYGKAGACRLKKYGIEYRTLSNFWLSSPLLTSWVYNQAVMAANCVDMIDDLLSECSPDYIQSIINESNVSEARRFVDQYNIEVPVYG